MMGTYTFLEVYGTLVGPGVATNIASDAAPAKEGISTAYSEAKNTATTGADGSLMQSMHATQTGKFTIRLLKTSPVNAVLNAAYNFQRQPPGSNWGQNTLRIVDKVRGDVETLSQAAFSKHADNAYGEDGNVLTWEFEGIRSVVLGSGQTSAAIP